jgi:diguanylate cyclase (GGDEF)-like protein/PAS domain S-box-containing protein
MPLIEDPEIFRTVLECLPTGVYLVDLDQRILFWNEGAEQITGYLRQDVVGHFCRDNLLAESRPDNTNQKAPPGAKPSNVGPASDAILSILRDGKRTFAEVSLRHKNGHRVFVRLRGVPIRNSHGTIVGAAESFDESFSASACDRRHDKLEGYGCLDPETGVLTHRLILSHLRESLATFAEHPVPFCILLIQIDAVDRLLAAYGRGVIPTCLSVVAQTLQNSLRPTDFLGRYSDALFLAVLTECSGSEIVLAANRLKKMVATSQVKWWGDGIPVTASFGAAYAIPGDKPESILRRAEKTLGASVAAGGNTVTVDTV